MIDLIGMLTRAADILDAQEVPKPHFLIWDDHLLRQYTFCKPALRRRGARGRRLALKRRVGYTTLEMPLWAK